MKRSTEDYESFLEELTKRKIDLESLMISTSKVTKDQDPEKWMTPALWKLIDVGIEIGQMEVPKDIEELGYVKCSKLIKSKRMLPYYYLTCQGIEPIILGGLFFKMEGVMFSKSMTKEIGYRDPAITKRSYPIRTASIDFLSEEYNLGTGRLILDGYSFVLKKIPQVQYVLNTASSWEFLDLNIGER